MPEILGRAGTAYVLIKPDFSHMDRDIARQTRGMSGHGSKLGKALSTGLKVGAGGAALALGGVAVAAKKSVEAFAEAEAVGKQTNAVLKSTRHEAGLSAKQIATLATAISRKSGMDDEAIQSGENLLLTFTNIHNQAGKGNNIFTQTTRIMADMSVALGQDTKSSAIQLGKALNDPIKGVTALQRVGVSFTQQQRDQIKTLVDSGRTMDAQKLILRELNKEFGGSAKAAGSTFQGSINKAKVEVGNLGEEVGSVLAPALKKGTDRFTDFVKEMQSNEGLGGRFMQSLRHGAKDAEGEIKGLVGRFHQLKGEGKTTGEALGTMLSDAFAKAMEKSAETAADRAPGIAKAFVKGFVNADVWGKLAIGGFLLAKFGGLGAFGKMGDKAGKGFGRKFGLGIGAALLLLAPDIGKALAQTLTNASIEAAKHPGVVGDAARAALGADPRKDIVVDRGDRNRRGQPLILSLPPKYQGGLAPGDYQGQGVSTHGGRSTSSGGGPIGDRAVDKSSKALKDYKQHATAAQKATDALRLGERIATRGQSAFTESTKLSSVAQLRAAQAQDRAAARAKNLRGEVIGLREKLSGLKRGSDEYRETADKLERKERQLNKAVRDSKPAADRARGGIRNLKGTWGDLGGTVSNVAGTIGDVTNKLLKGFGAKQIKLGLSAVSTGVGSALAVGGIPNPGSGSRDDHLLFDPRGKPVAALSGTEGIVNSPQMGEIDESLAFSRAAGVSRWGSLQELWRSGMRHYAGGGRVGPVNITGPSGYPRRIAQGGANKMRGAANRYLDRQEAKSLAADVLGGSFHGPTPKGFGTFDGLTVAKWIVPMLEYARAHGWTGHITSGYRSHAHNVAQGRTYFSEHERGDYPHGAVDFGGMQDPAGLANREAFLRAARGYRGPRLIRPQGFRDDGHLSGTGHRAGGLVGRLAAFAKGGVPGRKSHYSLRELEKLWVWAGGPPAKRAIAAGIAWRESRGQAHAENHNTNGTVDRGLWQINSVHGALSTFDPFKNARSAVTLYRNRGHDFHDWDAGTGNYLTGVHVPPLYNVSGVRGSRPGGKKDGRKFSGRGPGIFALGGSEGPVSGRTPSPIRHTPGRGGPKMTPARPSNAMAQGNQIVDGELTGFAPGLMDQLQSGLDDIDLHEQAGDITAQQAQQQRHQLRTTFLSNPFLTAHEKLQIRAQDHQDAPVEATQDLTEAIKALKESIDQQNGQRAQYLEAGEKAALKMLTSAIGGVQGSNVLRRRAVRTSGSAYRA